MQKATFSGKTLDDALSAAARSLGTDSSSLGYNILPSTGSGLLSKLFQKKVQIEAWVEGSDALEHAAREAVKEALSKNKRPALPQAQQQRRNNGNAAQQQGSGQQRPRREQPSVSSPRADSASSPERHAAVREARPPAPARRPRSADTASDVSARPERVVVPFDSPAVQQEVSLFTAAFLKVFGGGEFSVSLENETQEVVVNVENAAVESLLAESDRLSIAYEHLLKRILQRKAGDVAERIRLDAGSAVDVRQLKLEELAKSVAEKVLSTGRAITLNSKTSQERRIIHLTLEKREGVGTRSVGTGDRRKLVIFSTLKHHQQQRRKNQQAQQGGQRRQQQDPQGGRRFHQSRRGGNTATGDAEMATAGGEEVNNQTSVGREDSLD